MGGGKSTTSSQSIAIPPEVLARYNDVNSVAQQAAAKPFQQYSTDPSAFVAPLTSTQQAGIAGTNAAANQAQPYYNTATNQLNAAQSTATPYYGAATAGTAAAVGTGAGYAGQAQQQLAGAQAAANPYQTQAANSYDTAYSVAQPFAQQAGQNYNNALDVAQPLQTQAQMGYNAGLAGAQPYQQGATAYALSGGNAVDPSNLDSAAINKYLSPYLGTVVGNTAQLLNQQNQQAMAGQTGNAIRSGAFGGDRAGIAAAVLQGQQNLASGNVLGNLLNQGYNTALSTAQQQQGVGLGAAQANRAAQQQTAQELAAIGQQGYAQQTGTAAAQAALGQQEYGQQLGVGQAQQGLGQQQYAQLMGQGQAQQGLGSQVFGQGTTEAQQLAALGQQQYGQQLGAAQQLAGLGQGLYSMGANTSNQTAALGAGAQSAALSGAQAQLAAGQAQQQTDQAGKQALYNQFLQQQSYPFQTAQFLANIAEGTGSLSGSTTTTTQPGGFFSDKRLKENIHKIGETYDKQPIYSYNYKGDGRTQIGLMAQDVEKRHPDAVGLSSGYKTVDYGKATDKAAERGHFAGGGVAGYDPELSAAILANQSGMYGPYTTGLGGVGTGSGVPGGGSGRVPAANLPVGHLAVAGALPQQRSPLQSVNEAVGAVKGAEGLYKDGSALYDKVTAPKFDAAGASSSLDSALDSLDESKLNGLARGGVAGYAAGGMPYENQVATGLDIPDAPTNIADLSKPGSLPGQQSGLGQLKDVAGTASSLASLGKLLKIFNEGGRVGKADGGSLDALMASVKPAANKTLLQRLLAEQPEPIANDAPPADTPDDNSAPAPAAPATSASPIVAALATAAKASGDSAPAAGGTLAKIAKREGTGKNPDSSAVGKYQIIDDTFVNYFKKLHPDQAKGMNRSDILALRQSPDAPKLYDEIGPQIAADNKNTLTKAGITPTDDKIYLLHFLGPKYGMKLLGADSTTPVSDIVPASFISSNKRVLGGDKTAGDVLNWTGRMMRASGGRIGYAFGGDPANDFSGGQPDDGTPIDDAARKALELASAKAAVSANAPTNILPANFGQDTAQGLSAAQSPTNLLPESFGQPPQNDFNIPNAAANLAATSGVLSGDMPPPVTPEQAGLAAGTPDSMSSMPPAGAEHKGLGRQITDRLFHPQDGQTNLILPLLSGIAAMGTAPTRHFGTALAAGLGAGTQAYQGQREFGLEQTLTNLKPQELDLKRQQIDLARQKLPFENALLSAQTGLTGVQAVQQKALTDPLVQRAVAEGKLTQAQVTAVNAGLLDLKVVPGIGGGAGAIVVTDRRKLAAGDPNAVSTVDIGGLGSGAGTAAPAAPAGPTVAAPAPTPTGGVPAPTKGKSWNPVTTVPQGYTPPGQGILFLDPNAAAAAQANGQKDISDAATVANAASQQLTQLGQMGQQFGNLPKSGLLVPGAGSAARVGFAKAVNTAVQALGGAPIFNPSDIASAETISKDTNRLGFALARSLGSHEAASVVQQAITTNPGVENTPVGYARIAASAAQAAYYQRDRAAFFNDYFSKYHNTNGAEQLFEKLNPPSNYAKRAIMSTVDPRDVKALQTDPKNKAIRSAIDAKYGSGVSNYFVR